MSIWNQPFNSSFPLTIQALISPEYYCWWLEHHSLRLALEFSQNHLYLRSMQSMACRYCRFRPMLQTNFRNTNFNLIFFFSNFDLFYYCFLFCVWSHKISSQQISQNNFFLISKKFRKTIFILSQFFFAKQFLFCQKKKLISHSPASLSGKLSLNRHAAFTYSLNTSGLSAKMWCPAPLMAWNTY